MPLVVLQTTGLDEAHRLPVRARPPGSTRKASSLRRVPSLGAPSLAPADNAARSDQRTTAGNGAQASSNQSVRASAKKRARDAHRIGNSRPGKSSSGSTLRESRSSTGLTRSRRSNVTPSSASLSLEPRRRGPVHRDERGFGRALDRSRYWKKYSVVNGPELGRANDPLRRQEVDASREKEVRVAEAHALVLELGDEAAPAGVLDERGRHLGERRDGSGRDENAEETVPSRSRDPTATSPPAARGRRRRRPADRQHRHQEQDVARVAGDVRQGDERDGHVRRGEHAAGPRAATSARATARRTARAPARARPRWRAMRRRAAPDRRAGRSQCRSPSAPERGRSASARASRRGRRHGADPGLPACAARASPGSR